MSKIDLIVDQLKRAFDGEAWHGPALMEVLDGITANTAAARPL
ncbi:MAG: DinB family protein, partial [Acidobacteria bacterium]|nr:DinB family protein [Acidobacteriota bacterium]